MGGHVRGVCEGEHMVVEVEVLRGVGSGGGVSQRSVGVGWLGWVWGGCRRGERKKEVMYGSAEGVLM